MWRRPECPRFTLPLAVFLKRLDAPLCDFNFGISPLSQLPAASCQPPVGNSTLLSIALESSARIAPVLGELLSLGNWIWNFCCRGGCRRRFFFLLRQLLFLLRLLLGFSFSFFLALDCRFLWRQDGVQRVAFLPRPELYDTVRFYIFNQPFEYLPAQPRPGHFAAPEKYRGLYLVSSIEKAEHMIFLGLVIMVVHIDAELDLFYGDRLLMLLGFTFFLFLLVEILPVVHDAAHGRLRGGRNLNQIQVLAAGQLESFEGRHYADLFTFVSDHANFTGSNAVVGSNKTFVDTVLRALSDWEKEIIAWGFGTP